MARKSKKDADWYDLRVDGDPEGCENFYIRAYHHETGEMIGEVEIRTKTKWNDAVVVIDAFVEEKYLRRGVATALYDKVARITGKSVLPYSYFSSDESMSDDAKAFWRARNPDMALDDDE